MNQIGGIISEFINLFNQHIKKLIQSSDIVVFVFFLRGESPKIICKIVHLFHSSDSQTGLWP